MKYYKVIGLLACALMILSCFLPWAYYADLNKTFNGFFSEQNNYGKPGKFFVFFAIVSMALINTSKVWAKRVHLFLSALNIGYLIKTYILFTSCYNTYCPEKRAGLYLLILSSVVIMVVSIFPDLKIANSTSEEKID
ncbi:MAG TPA: hypothetical protein VGP55_06845 [Chitinophagaceae bacterium]|nr:hypothetical protein [Chitinophagaceae bacterium]